MADKRDYYEVLGIDKNASEQDIKKPIVNWPKNIIRIQTPVMQMPQINLKK